MATLDAFWHQDMRDLHSTNDALLTLLPKSPKAQSIRDYRPISLIHVVRKLISKLLANRLAPKISALVHNSQSTFIRGCSICWDRPSAFAGINRRLLLGSTVGSCWDRPSELRSARMLNLTQQTEEEEDEQ
jgi:hypothetical protein